MSITDHFFWDFEGKRSEGLMCNACERGDHANCGQQTWCTCDCDGTENMYYDFEELP